MSLKMYKKYDSTLLVKVETPTFICSYHTEQTNKIIKQVEVSATSITPMEMVKETLVKGISSMKDFNDRIDKQYPHSILAYVK